MKKKVLREKYDNLKIYKEYIKNPEEVKVTAESKKRGRKKKDDN